MAGSRLWEIASYVEIHNPQCEKLLISSEKFLIQKWFLFAYELTLKLLILAVCSGVTVDFNITLETKYNYLEESFKAHFLFYLWVWVSHLIVGNIDVWTYRWTRCDNSQTYDIKYILISDIRQHEMAPNSELWLKDLKHTSFLKNTSSIYICFPSPGEAPWISSTFKCVCVCVCVCKVLYSNLFPLHPRSHFISYSFVLEKVSESGAVSQYVKLFLLVFVLVATVENAIWLVTFTLTCIYNMH
jgi:hypothetical protein